ncbi:hypothetical protein [Streptomyces sp. SID3343]|uniref:hypothetical protein n=1 Tax=Streptomyces sp. SID3343 TaxID=2690260 RepID=UPI00136FE4E4|nr:hypothetical protein [Streptomyces sp. SID3343]MYW00377.1 hypothetical protein [Streptomyces sp. SID3343]MYW04580.1 hypothetical protein [Streptomyces sp. SID3343]
MGSCQRSTARNNGKTCANPTRQGQRYCGKHGGGKRPGGSKRSRKNSGDGCGGLFILALTTLVLLALGILM